MGSALGSYDLDVTTNTISGQKANTSHIHLLRVNVRSWSAIYATLWGATFRNIYYLVILHWQLALKKNTFPHKQFRGKGWGEMLAGEGCIDWQTGLCGSLSLPTSHFFPEAGRCSPRGGRDERQTAWGMCGSTSVYCSAGLGFCAMSTQPRDFCLVCSFARLSAWVFEERNPWECGGDADRDSSHFLLQDRMSWKSSLQKQVLKHNFEAGEMAQLFKARLTTEKYKK